MRSELLEPCAEMIRTHGSEGRTVQRCAVLTRRCASRDHLFWQIAVTSVPYPFPSQMAKIQLRACADRLATFCIFRISELSNRVLIAL